MVQPHTNCPTHPILLCKLITVSAPRSTMPPFECPGAFQWGRYNLPRPDRENMMQAPVSLNVILASLVTLGLVLGCSATETDNTGPATNAGGPAATGGAATSTAGGSSNSTAGGADSTSTSSSTSGGNAVSNSTGGGNAVSRGGAGSTNATTSGRAATGGFAATGGAFGFGQGGFNFGNPPVVGP